MSKANTWEEGLLKLLFQNIAFTGVGDAGGLLPSAVAGSLYISLHTADPLDGGAQSTSEIVYTGYARVAVVRSAGGWTVTNVDNGPSTVNPVANIDFPVATGGTGTATHFGVGTASSGAGKLLYSGTITPPIAVTTGVIPRLTTASVITED